MSTASFEARLQSVVRQVVDTRIDLLALMLTDTGVDAGTVRQRLGALIRALHSPRVEATIFANGRRLATSVEDGVLLVNRELLERVGNPEILSSLARPVAELTELAPVMVSLAFQIDDDQVLRDLTLRAQRSATKEVIRASMIREWVEYRVEVLSQRLLRLCGQLGRASVFERGGAGELQARVQESEVWPEWADVSDLGWCVSAVAALEEALEGTEFEPHSETLAELMWDSVVLSTQSFLRHAGRGTRSLERELDVSELLIALANAVSGDEFLEDDVAQWPAYQDVADAWTELNREECGTFGPVRGDFPAPPASVLDPARNAFGIDQPSELPWDLPLLCWTTREQRALRDLLNGLIKTLHGQNAQAEQSHTATRPGTEPALVSGGARKMLSVQIAPLGADASLLPAQSDDRTWAACVNRVLEQFAASDAITQEGIIASLRAAYDSLFPESQAIWERRLFDLDDLPMAGRAQRLVTAINGVFGPPMFFDPFLDPSTNELAPMATVVLPVGVTANTRVAFSVPMVALKSTLNGSPLRLRAVEVSPQSDQPCRWLCDRGLHLSKLAKQSVELLTTAIRGDALQMSLFES